MKIRFCGDVHGKYTQYKRIISECPVSIQVGDMGVGFIRNRDRDGELRFSQNPPFDAMTKPGESHLFIRGNHDCCTAEVECLTKRGWLKYFEILDDDEILSWVEGGCVWTKINDITIKEYSGNLICKEGGEFSLHVTPTHRVLLKGVRTEDYKYIAANNLPYAFEIPVSANCNNVGVNLSSEEISLAGWILTDGNIYKRTLDSGDEFTEITIYQSKEENLERIRNILNFLEISFYEMVRDRGIKEICDRVLKKRPLKQHEFRIHAKSKSKVLSIIPEKGVLPVWAFDLNESQFEIFLDSLISGDGVWNYIINGVRDKDKKGEKRCATLHGTKRFLDSVQVAAVQHGWRTSLVQNTRGDFVLNLTKKSTIYIEKNTIFLKPYLGVVWCLSVPHTNFMVRDNGRAYFTGNSPAVCARHKCWIPDGTFEPGTGMMFVGGGFSIDRAYRVENESWWADEELSVAELYSMVDDFVRNVPHIMVTHECPASVAKHLFQGHYKNDLMVSRTSQAFQSMFEIHQPEKWYFGHWHESRDEVINGTRFICLAELEYRDDEIELLT